jgi:hypothetical protein
VRSTHNVSWSPANWLPRQWRWPAPNRATAMLLSVEAFRKRRAHLHTITGYAEASNGMTFSPDGRQQPEHRCDCRTTVYAGPREQPRRDPTSLHDQQHPGDGDQAWTESFYRIRHPR